MQLFLIHIKSSHREKEWRVTAGTVIKSFAFSFNWKICTTRAKMYASYHVSGRVQAGSLVPSDLSWRGSGIFYVQTISRKRTKAQNSENELLSFINTEADAFKQKTTFCHASKDRRWVPIYKKGSSCWNPAWKTAANSMSCEPRPRYDFPTSSIWHELPLTYGCICNVAKLGQYHYGKFCIDPSLLLSIVCLNWLTVNSAYMLSAHKTLSVDTSLSLINAFP